MKFIYTCIFILISLNLVFSKTLIVNQKHHNANDTNQGNSNNPFFTINAAAQLALPGDTVLVLEGIYRERISPAVGGNSQKPVVYLANKGDKVILKGSDVWKNEWQHLKENIYKSKIDLEKLKNYNPFYIQLARQPGRKSLGQIFCNGYCLTQTDSLNQVEKSLGTWMLSYDSTEIIINYPKKLLHCPVEDCLIEYSVREKVFAPHKRGLGYIIVEGFIIEHCANQFPSGFYNERGKGFPQSGALSTRSGHHWTIRKNIIRYAKTLGIDCGYEGAYDNEGNQPMPNRDSIGFHLIEHNTITDCGAGGIAGASQRATIIRYNRIERTNNLGFTAPETGGIKVHFFFHGLIEGNILRDNECSGIWLDNQWYNSRVTRNVITGSRAHGIFIEMGNGNCLVDNNIVAFSKVGDGIYMHDASGVTIAHNLLYGNAHFGVYMRTVTERVARNEKNEREIVSTSDNKLVNNVFIDNYRGPVSMPLETKRWGENNSSDYNLFINGAQWDWEGLDFNLFSIGTNDSRISKDSVALVLEKVLVKQNYSREQLPNFRLWANSPLVPFQWWQIFMGYDQNSKSIVLKRGEIEDGAVEKGTISLSSLNLTFNIRNGKLFNLLKCPGLSEIKSDFYGKSHSQKEVIPGPFSHYSDNENEFVLIPTEL